MQCIYLNDNQQLELGTIPTPEVTDGMVLIRVKRAGICATDIGYWKFGSNKLKLPVILGHEFSGVVEKIGDGVTSVRPGDHVTAMNDYFVCGECRYCKSGATNMCIKRRSLGSVENGAFAEFVLVPDHTVIKLPDSINFSVGALLEVTSCGIHAFTKVTPLTGEETVLIMGPGAIGASAGLFAKTRGCKVIAAGLSQDAYRLSILKKMGLDYSVDIQTENLTELILDITDGYGADVVVESSGSYKSLETCLAQVAKKGRYVQMGVLHGVGSIDMSPLIMKELSAFGSYAKTKEAWYLAIDLINSGKLNLEPMVSEVKSFKDYKDAFKIASGVENFRIMFDPEL